MISCYTKKLFKLACYALLKATFMEVIFSQWIITAQVTLIYDLLKKDVYNLNKLQNNNFTHHGEYELTCYFIFIDFITV